MALPTSSSAMPIQSTAQTSTSFSLPSSSTLRAPASPASPNRPCPYSDGRAGLSGLAERGMLHT